jgi:hypothetical protein
MMTRRLIQRLVRRFSAGFFKTGKILREVFLVGLGKNRKSMDVQFLFDAGFF